MQKRQVIWTKFKLFWNELGNIIFNVFCPILSTLAALAELFQLPASVIDALKKAEYWCFYACGTKKTIDKLTNKVADALEDGKISKEEALDVGRDVKESFDKLREDLKK